MRALPTPRTNSLNGKDKKQVTAANKRVKSDSAALDATAAKQAQQKRVANSKQGSQPTKRKAASSQSGSSSRMRKVSLENTASQQRFVDGSEQAETANRAASATGRQAAVTGRQRAVSNRQPGSTGRQAAVTGRQAAVTGRQAAVTGRQAAVTGRQAAVTGRQKAVRQLKPSDIPSIEGSPEQTAGKIEAQDAQAAQQRKPQRRSVNASGSGKVPARTQAKAAQTGASKPVVQQPEVAKEPAEPNIVQKQAKKIAAAPKHLKEVAVERDIAGAATRGAKGLFQKHRKTMTAILVVLALLIGFGIFDTVSTVGKVHAGVSVQGVDVGGLTAEEAANKISEELSPVLDASKVVMYASSDSASIDGRTVTEETNGIEQAYAAVGNGSDQDMDGSDDKWKLKARTSGAYIDGAALASKAFAVGRSATFLPERLKAWLGGVSIPVDVAYDQEDFKSLVDEVNKQIGSEIVDSKVEITNGKVSVKEGHDGWAVDEELLKSKLTKAYFNDEEPYLIVPMAAQTLHITKKTAQKVADVVEAAISEKVTITYGKSKWKLKAADLGSLISQKVLEPDQVLVIGDGNQKVKSAETAEAEYDTTAGTDSASKYILQAYVNQKKFDKYLVSILGDKATGGARDAKFKIKNGKVVIKPSKTGSGPDRKAAELQMQNILFGSSSSYRTIELVDTTIEPSLTTEKAKSMGIKEKLSSWSIPLVGSEARIYNIHLLCKLIDHSIVAPNEAWSFNETCGELSKENGFKEAPVINGDRHEDAAGGGACQVATCVFNCACFAGLGINHRTNHTFYTAMYDDTGFADATVYWPEPDLEWVNDMQNYILVTASADSGDVVVTFWGTDEGREVTCDRGEWKKGTKYSTVKEYDDELPAGSTSVEQTGIDGRSIIIHYIAKDKDGNVLHDIEFNSYYEPQNEIIKVGTAGSSSSSSKSSKDSSDDSDSDDSSSSDDSDGGTEDSGE